MLAVSVLWVKDYIFVFFNNINNMQLDAELFCDPQSVVALLFLLIFRANSVCMAFNTEAREKIDALDMDALIQDYPCRQHGV